jgi:hypothetical protein
MRIGSGENRWEEPHQQHRRESRQARDMTLFWLNRPCDTWCQHGPGDSRYSCGWSTTQRRCKQQHKD